MTTEVAGAVVDDGTTGTTPVAGLDPPSVSADLVHKRGRLATIWRWGGPPVLAYLAGHLLCGLAAYLHGYDWLSADSRIRWDGGIYLDIAHTGYYAAPCEQINPDMHLPNAMCGNAGWFPLFPYLVLGLTKLTGLGLPSAGVLVTEVCWLGVLILLWRLLDGTVTTATLGSLAVAAVLPSGIYFHATYPMALSVLLALVTFLLLRRGHWVPAGLAAAAAATSYPLGVLLAPAAVAFLLIPPGRWSWRRLASTGYVATMTAAGTLGVFGLLRLTTGRFDAFLRIQTSIYGHGLHNPAYSFLTVLRRPPLALSAELLFSTALVALALLAVNRTSARRPVTVLDWALARRSEERRVGKECRSRWSPYH